MIEYKKISLTLVLLVIILLALPMALAPPPPPGGTATPPAVDPSGAAATTSAPPAGYIRLEVAPGRTKDILESNINVFLKNCPVACDQKTATAYAAESNNWRVGYDSKTDTFYEDNNLQKPFYYSDRGGTRVYQTGDEDSETNILVGVEKYPYSQGKSFSDVAKVENGVVYYKDGTVQVANTVPIPIETYERYKSEIDVQKALISAGSVSGTIPLKNGNGNIQITNQPGGSREVKVVGRNSEVLSHQISLPTGDSFDAGEFSYLEEGDKNGGYYTNKKTGEEYKTKHVAGEFIVTYKKGDKETIKTVRKVLEDDGSSVIEVEERDDGKTQSVLIYDQNKKLIARKNDDTFGDLEGPLSDFQYYELLSDKGEVIGICKDAVCDGSPNNDKNIFANSDGACTGSHSACFDAEGKPKDNQWKNRQELGCSTQNSDVCLATDRADDAPLFRQDGPAWDLFLGKQGEWQKTLGGILSYRPGWDALSTWWAPEMTQEWQKSAAMEFLNSVSFSENIVPAAVCDSKSADTIHKPGQAATFIEVAPGQTQSVAAITAERTDAQSVALCAEDVPCKIGHCSEDGVCLDDTTNNPLNAHFYKISWSVRSPADEANTPYIDENGYSVFYNVMIYDTAGNSFYLYPGDDLGFGSDETLSLKGGESDNDVYIAYSPVEYREICIDFGGDANGEPDSSDRGPKDIDGDIVETVCADFAVSSASENIWAKSTRSGSRGSVRVADLGRKQI